jgi:hypothetical protein
MKNTVMKTFKIKNLLVFAKRFFVVYSVVKLSMPSLLVNKVIISSLSANSFAT